MSDSTDYVYTSVCRKDSDIHQMLDELVEDSNAINNYGQAVKYCIRTTMQQRENGR